MLGKACCPIVLLQAMARTRVLPFEHALSVSLAYPCASGTMDLAIEVSQLLCPRLLAATVLWWFPCLFMMCHQVGPQEYLTTQALTLPGAGACRLLLQVPSCAGRITHLYGCIQLCSEVCRQAGLTAQELQEVQHNP